MLCLKTHHYNAQKYVEGEEYELDDKIADGAEKWYGEKLWDRGGKKAKADDAEAETEEKPKPKKRKKKK